MSAQAGFYPDYFFFNVLAGLILVLLVGQGAIRLARKMGLLDLPGALPHKRHSQPTPLAGGITLAAALLAASLFVDGDARDVLWRIALPGVVVFIFALWDDFKHLPAWVKLAGQVLAGAALIGLGTYVRVLQDGFLGLSGPILMWGNWFITLFWIVGMTNAFNLIDSMDGLVVGVAGLALLFMILVALVSGQPPLLQVMTIMLGICLGLGFYNTTPARFFLGDSGAQTVGFLLAAIAIIFTPGERPLASSWFIPILILGVPIFDTTLVTLSRLRRRTPIYKAGYDHTYHRLLRAGLDNRRAVLVIHITGVILGCLAFIALTLEPLFASIMFAAVCLAGLGLIFWMDRKLGNDD
ncbi:MAG: undecaprenyl/decaprenyl-phosphate alpha-N-acetylglucosaminyl 1-phosphate transferase [Chloroflexi bacterium]|nr:undecaprenyl/decaprenyl-phosphate alpha-N-acetylglucosaminyl 1-phosphate transferase [Chloroflexota bacterium]